jgi:hypothetical protein
MGPVPATVEEFIATFPSSVFEFNDFWFALISWRGLLILV